MDNEKIIVLQESKIEELEAENHYLRKKYSIVRRALDKIYLMEVEGET
jgi:hypothetical protein